MLVRASVVLAAIGVLLAVVYPIVPATPAAALSSHVANRVLFQDDDTASSESTECRFQPPAENGRIVIRPREPGVDVEQIAQDMVEQYGIVVRSVLPCARLFM